ncbi:MAG: hypothetical protein J5986_01280 [Roseburia sp.]|nr:hypothetical protein [Roseburia sp.]
MQLRKKDRAPPRIYMTCEKLIFNIAFSGKIVWENCNICTKKSKTVEKSGNMRYTTGVIYSVHNAKRKPKGVHYEKTNM